MFGNAGERKKRAEGAHPPQNNGRAVRGLLEQKLVSGGISKELGALPPPRPEKSEKGCGDRDFLRKGQGGRRRAHLMGKGPRKYAPPVSTK